MLRRNILFLILLTFSTVLAQIPVDLSGISKKNGAKAELKNSLLTVNWPAGGTQRAVIVFDLEGTKPLFRSIQLSDQGVLKEIGADLDPNFLLRVGKRTLSASSGGWDVFFDRVPTRPYQSYKVEFSKRKAHVMSKGSQTIISISEINAGSFKGSLEITLYSGSPLFNIAAVMETMVDSTAILYDAGLISRQKVWDTISWSDVRGDLQTVKVNPSEPARNVEVKYRTIVGQSDGGSLAVFPAPHQYFYPLDEAFNLKFTWYGNNYTDMISGFGIGIRQDPLGDKRYVPWFNAPPGTKQRLNFFCLLGSDKANLVLEDVKKYTHNDSYVALPGYKTMSSHFHNEFTMNVALKDQSIPEKPEFVHVFKKAGVNIVHLGEFHGTGHPRGPDAQRLKELHTLFQQCERLSDEDFLLLPGEEPNNFYGGHWLNFFPRPVYWIMSRKPEMPFVTMDPTYGKVYRIADKHEMLKLLELENGLAWTAHARTKSSTGFPDIYKDEPFFKSETFMGAAWKAIPGDLSLPTLSKRVLNLLDDMANWESRKHVIAESDIFTITEQNEMYAHLNVNYLQLDKLPAYNESWQPVLDAMSKGKFFVSTGEVLLPVFTVAGKKSGETARVPNKGKMEIVISVDWTFPLNFAEIISGDGKEVFRERLDLTDTQSFGKNKFIFNTNLTGRKWVRVEVWDIAANGAFTQQVWLN